MGHVLLSGTGSSKKSAKWFRNARISLSLPGVYHRASDYPGNWLKVGICFTDIALVQNPLWDVYLSWAYIGLMPFNCCESLCTTSGVCPRKHYFLVFIYCPWLLHCSVPLLLRSPCLWRRRRDKDASFMSEHSIASHFLHLDQL